MLNEKADQYGCHFLPLLLCWGFNCWFEEEGCQNAVSLNNRNTDRQLPSLEGVRLKSWSIFLCNICIKMAGSAPVSRRSLCSLSSKCLFSQSMSEGSTIATSPRWEYVDEFTLYVWHLICKSMAYVQKQWAALWQCQYFSTTCRVGTQTNDRPSISANECTTGAEDWGELIASATNDLTGQLQTHRETKGLENIHIQTY